MRREQFTITVPLDDKKVDPDAPTDEDEDRGEPPPML
jgi:hypothetical protein